MVGSIIAAILVGLIVGFIARALLPGKQEMGFVATILLGLAGSLVGYFLFTELLGIGDSDKFDFGGVIGAVIGAMIVLYAYERFVSKGRTAPRRR